MIILRGIALAFAMFSRLPAPRVAWREDNMRYMLVGFPLIGAVLGAILFAWVALCRMAGFGALLTACGLTLLPVAVTGGIHLDGFCDTIDALASHAEPKRKCEILKDPHIGAFAVMALCCYLILYCTLCTELPFTPQVMGLMLCGHVFTRVMSAFSVVYLPCESGGGTLHSFADAAHKARVCLVLFCLLAGCTAGLLWLSPGTGTLMLLAGGASFGWLARFSLKEFGGMRGDLAGYFLQVSELLLLAALVIGTRGGWL